MKKSLLFLAVFSSLAITACDDDDDCEQCPPFTITSENADRATAAVMETTFDVVDSSEISRDAAEEFTKKAEDAQSQATSVASTVTGVSINIPFDCDSGSVNVSWGDNDNNSARSLGDGFTLTFNQCFLQDAGATLNGSMSLTLGAAVDLQPIAQIGFNLAINFQSLQVSSDSELQVLDGDLAIQPSAVVENETSKLALALSGTSLTLNEPNKNEVSTLTNYTLKYTVEPRGNRPYRLELNGTLATTDLGGPISFQTAAEQPFTGFDETLPEAGVMTLQGTNLTVSRIPGINATLTVEAIGGGNVNLQLNAATQTTWEVILQ